MMRGLILGLVLLPLAGCGFTPMYGSGSTTGSGPIMVEEIDGRTGHYLRQELVRTVGRGVPGFRGDGRLEVKLTENINRLAFAPDQAASRSDYVVTANYTLFNAAGQPALTGQVYDTVSFNFADAAYADIAAQTAAQERVANLLANSIRERLAIDAARPTSQPTAQPAPAQIAAPPR
jgi:LPS-assembly lipoprotein